MISKHYLCRIDILKIVLIFEKGLNDLRNELLCEFDEIKTDWNKDSY